MDQELRRAMYVAAAIQGMLTAESPDVAYGAAWVADRAVEIANTAMQLEDGTLVLGEAPPELEGEAGVEAGVEAEDLELT